MSETRKLAAILVADMVGYSRLAGVDEEPTLARLRGLRSDLIDPAIAAHHGRAVKRTGDGAIVEFRSVVNAVRCEFAEASVWLRKSIDANRNRPLAFFLLAACLAHLGRLDEARREVKAGLAVDPKFTLGRFRAGDQSDNAVYLAQRARLAEGMRLAGVPEG